MPHNGRLRTILLGLDGVGADYLAAIADNDQFELIAVADDNADLVRKAQDELGVIGYEDYRSIIVETASADLDVAFIALMPFRSCEIVPIAASRGVHVFHSPPFARSLSEARKLIGRFNQADCSLAVGRPWWWEPAFARLHSLSEWIGRVHAATATVRTAQPPVGWRGDAVRAGGGVLLNGAYEQVDMLTVLLGVPEEVYAHCVMARNSDATRKHDTEDAASLVLRYAHDRTASLTVSNGSGEAGWSVTFDGADGAVCVTPGALTLSLNGSAPLTFRSRSKQSVAPAVHAFAEAMLDPDEAIRPTTDDHTKTLAVIEAAYLSSKTRSPESPSQFLG